ncbi:MAG TPA: DNA cytosine methyltransferase [Bacteroidales bacterium]|nr:DNA cytosine methyltransferase [Bacteroidales bacterium]
MRGGRRKGSGRKKLDESERRISKNIYITEELSSMILETDINNATSFSQKCVELIKIGLEQTERDNMINNNKSKAKRTTKKNELTFIDLFAGIGGIRKGFEDNSTKCVFSSEWDKYAALTYEKNYGEIPHGDITKIHETEIPDHDILLAGFPCQPFSHIGQRQGFAHETQGTLFFDILRILKEKRPKAFLLENVKGLLTNDRGNTFKVIMKNLHDLGYSVFYEVMDAQNFGLPQRRERVVIVGFRPDLKIESFEFPKGNKHKKVKIKDILEKNPKGYSISKHLQKNYLFKTDDNRPQLVDFDSEIQVNTLVASYHKIQRLTGTFVRDGETGIRLFSELEVKRLMGFPDDFIVPVSRTQMYRQFGNSVAVPMMKEVGDLIKKTIRDAEKTK